MENKWSAKTYKRAAQKHFSMCCFLIENIDLASPDKKPHVISDFYYLSGYILECILKYCIMEEEHLVGTYSLSEISDNNLKNHNIKELWHRATENGRLDQREFEKWHQITNEWNEQVRYEVNATFQKKNDVCNHFSKIVEPVYTHIINKY